MRGAPSSGAERLLPVAPAAVGLGAAAVVLVVFPLARLAWEAVRLGPLGDSLAGTAGSVVNSLWTSAVAAAVASVIGVAAALAAGPRPRPALRIAVLLPLLVPPFVSAVAWGRAFGPGGLSDDLVGWTLPGLVGPAGVVIVLAVHASPLVYLAASAALATRARPELEWAARACGAATGETLRRVTLPLLAPAVAGGGALAFVVSLNSFGIPAVLGTPAGFSTITTRIYGDLARSADPAAFRSALFLSLGMVLLVMLAVAAAGAALRRGVTAAGAGREAFPAPGHPMGRGLLWAWLGVSAGFPLLALALTALTRAVGLDPWPGNWTLGNFAEAWGGGAWGTAGRSLALAALAATGATLLGAALALWRGRRGSGGALWVTATFALPGSALAVALLVGYGPWLRDTLFLILLAYLAKFWALAHRTVAGSAGLVERDEVHAGRVSGAGRALTLRRLVLPRLRPALVAAWLVVFLFGLHELTMSSLLYGPGTATLAVLTLEVQQLGDATVTAALAVLLTLPGFLAAALLARGGEAP